MKSKISMQNLDLYYQNSQVLHNINLEIAAQKTTAMIGPPGSGKSACLRVMNRLHDMQKGVRVEGTVLLDGFNIFQARYDTALLRKKVGMIFPKPQVFPISVYENVAFGPRLHGIKSRYRLNEIIENCLRLVGMWDDLCDCLKTCYPMLTPGQQQRLCLARLLAVNPDVLLLDEPTLTLNSYEADQLERIVLNLKQQYTIVLATQNSGRAARLSDYTAFLHSGIVVEFGSTGDIFTRPTHRRTEDYLTRRFS